MEKLCVECGCRFLPKRFWQRFCTRECKGEFWKAEQKAARAALKKQREAEKSSEPPQNAV